MTRVILFNKPWGVLTQFTDSAQRRTLKDFINVSGVYPAGRLDRDSEGLVVLTDDGKLQQRIASPQFKLAKTYLVQVENIPDDMALKSLRNGVELKDGVTRPALAGIIDDPDIWPRDPPIRYRARIPTCWLSITLTEGRNRQVRRMTAAVGHPTLRLVRYTVGPWTLKDLPPGSWRQLSSTEIESYKQDYANGLETSRHRRRHHSRRQGKVPHGRGNQQRPRRHESTRRPPGTG